MARPIPPGTRDAKGVWHADDPSHYRDLRVAGQLPWTVLHATTGGWRARKRYWKGLIPDTVPLAADGALPWWGRHAHISRGVSVFDPVLAEILIEWYSRPGDLIGDPFAGGPVRGHVAGRLGRRYLGVDINPAQVEANQAGAPAGAEWVHGDGGDKAARRIETAYTEGAEPC